MQQMLVRATVRVYSRMMKWLVDIDAAVADGLLSAEQGAALKARAGTDALGFGTSLLLIGGILAVMAGLLAFFPTPEGLLGTGLVIAAVGAAALVTLDGRFRLPANAAAVIGNASATAGGIGIAVEATETTLPAVWIGLVLFAAGLVLRWFGPPAWRVMAAWVVVIGGAAHIGGVFGLDGSPDQAWLAMMDAAAVLLVAGLTLDLRILTALGITALAGTLSATAYGHASYWLAVYEPSLLILMMAGVAAVSWAIGRGPERWARHGRISGLMALIWINIAFWVGSLWGDRPGEHVFGPTRSDFPSGSEGAWAFYDARDSFAERLLDIPDGAFALGWAALILAAAAWASLTARRPVMNAAAAFGAIHLYTQWFERLGDEPLAIILAGISAIALAWGMVQLNVWMRERRKEG
ncbi:MAG: hypothetical protein AAFX62_00700 [Pseudomonadota bacterium]